MSPMRQPPTCWKPAKNRNHSTSQKPLFTAMPTTCRAKLVRSAKAVRIAAPAWAA